MNNLAHLIKSAAGDKRRRTFRKLKQMFWDKVSDIMPRVEAEYEQEHGYIGDGCDYQAWMEVLGMDSEVEAENFVHDNGL
jgi:hypothetical protein